MPSAINCRPSELPIVISPETRRWFAEDSAMLATNVRSIFMMSRLSWCK